MASGFSGAFPTSASFSRSAINLYAGARTGWASLFATLVVLVVLLWLTPALHHVPQAVLAAVVIAAVVSLVRPQVLLRLWRVSRVEALTGGATFVLTLATAPRLYWGVLAGLLISLSHFLYQRLHPRIIEVGLHPDGSLRDRHLWHLPPLAPHLYALRMDAELDFASASALERAVVVTAVTSLIKPGTLLRLWRVSRVEAVIGGVTFALTLATAPRMYWGVLVGLLMNLSHFLYQRLHPRIIEVGLHPDGSLRDRHLWQLPPLAPRLLALRMDAELDFASASALERRVTEHLAAHPEVVHLCLLAQPINRIDVTGVETFAQLLAQMELRGGTLHLSGLKLPVEQVLRQAGLLDLRPGLAMYRTDAEALVALQQLPDPVAGA